MYYGQKGKEKYFLLRSVLFLRYTHDFYTVCTYWWKPLLLCYIPSCMDMDYMEELLRNEKTEAKKNFLFSGSSVKNWKKISEENICSLFSLLLSSFFFVLLLLLNKKLNFFPFHQTFYSIMPKRSIRFFCIYFSYSMDLFLIDLRFKLKIGYNTPSRIGIG